MALKRDKYDKVFSDYIRTRDKFCCTYCHRFVPEDKRAGLHASHFYSRANKAVRWDEENCDSHCYGCHRKLGANPALFAAWKRQRMGDARYFALMRRAGEVRKWTQNEKDAMYKDYQDKLKKLQDEPPEDLL